MTSDIYNVDTLQTEHNSTRDMFLCWLGASERLQFLEKNFYNF